VLARYTREGRNVCAKRTANNYAPGEFSKESEAKGLRKEHLEAAMRTLFAIGKVRLEEYGRPSRPYSRLVAV
jgi:hypothetical protein